MSVYLLIKIYKYCQLTIEHGMKVRTTGSQYNFMCRSWDGCNHDWDITEL